MVNILCFFNNVYVPLELSIFVSSFCFLCIYTDFKSNKIGMAALVVILVYFLPFIHIIPYLWFDFSSNPTFMWGLIANPYNTDEEIIKLTATLGSTGALSFVFVNSFIKKEILYDKGISNLGMPIKQFTTLPLYLWALLVIAGIYLSYISAPEESVFMSSYTESSTISRNANFSSAWLISYIFIIFAFVDANIESNLNLRRLKLFLSFISIAYIVIVLQFLRGDRESLPWIFALFLIYSYWCANYRLNKRKYSINKFKIFTYFSIFLISSFVVGALRSNVSGADLALAVDIFLEILSSEGGDINNFIKGTWTAVLLTPLSVAGDYVNNLHEFNYGSDYYGLLASSMPGFVADTFDIDRPFALGSGPAQEMTYGLGGTHAVVVPFRAFGIPGIFLIISIWYALLVYAERKLLSRFNIFSISFIAMIVSVSAHWLWYGEKNILNGIIIYIVISLIYVAFLLIGHSSKSKIKI